jgi:hypothetical protein
MHAFQLFGFVILLTAQSAISQDQECPSPYLREMSRKTLLLFGDSLTQRSFDEGGWGARLAGAYQRKVLAHQHVLRTNRNSCVGLPDVYLQLIYHP